MENEFWVVGVLRSDIPYLKNAAKVFYLCSKTLFHLINCLGDSYSFLGTVFSGPVKVGLARKNCIDRN